MSTDEKIEKWFEDGRDIGERAKGYNRYRDALRQGHVETERSEASPIATDYTESIMIMITTTVYELWRKLDEPEGGLSLQQIFDEVIFRIKELDKLEEWKSPATGYKWGIPSKRTVDRCVNFTADRRHPLWKTIALDLGHPERVVTGTIGAIKLESKKKVPGYYLPNPAKFDDLTQRELFKIISEIEGR